MENVLKMGLFSKKEKTQEYSELQQKNIAEGKLDLLRGEPGVTYTIK